MKPKYGFIVAQPAQCRKCGKPITILETEATTIQLNASGYPIGYRTELYKVKGFCSECGAEYDINKDGIQYRIVDDTLFYYGGNVDEKKVDTVSDGSNPA